MIPHHTSFGKLCMASEAICRRWYGLTEPYVNKLINNVIKMKLVTPFITLLLTVLVGCQENDPNPVADFSHIHPVATDVGIPVGEVVSQMVGTAGGEVISADGRLRLNIPAGALSTNTTIGIQSITNNAPLGLGNNYRLTPQGTTFTQPATLTFGYDEAMLETAEPDFLWAVTQNANGTWSGGRKSVVNKTAKTVTVTTTHFSDWGMGRFVDLTLVPPAATVQVNENVPLSITGFKYDPDHDDDDLVPLAHIDDDLVGLNEGQQLLLSTEQFTGFRVKYWALNGATAPVDNSNGKLAVDGKKATYTAPGRTPNPATLTASVNLEAKDNTGKWHAYSLLSNITVLSEYYMKMVVDGEELYYVHNAPEGEKDIGTAVYMNASKTLFFGAQTNGTGGFTKGNFTVQFEMNGIGTYPLSNDPDVVAYLNSNNQSLCEIFYNRYHTVERDPESGICFFDETKIADLTFNITKFDNDIVGGNFYGKLYLSLNCPDILDQCPEEIPSVTISGEFRTAMVKQ